MTEKSDKKKKRRSWASVIRLSSGTILTALWCAGAAWYVFDYVGWQCFVKLEPNEIGDFCAGFAAPLAFFWLVLGYFQQGEELKLQSTEMSSQREAIEANELHARRDTFMRFAEQIMHEQAELAASLMPATAKAGHGVEMAWTRYSQGGRNSFYAAIIENGFRRNPADATSRIRHDRPERDRATLFVVNCERIFSECDKCDKDNLIRAFFEQSAMGSVYAGFCLILERKSVFRVREKPTDLTQIF